MRPSEMTATVPSKVVTVEACSPSRFAAASAVLAAAEERVSDCEYQAGCSAVSVTSTLPSRGRCSLIVHQRLLWPEGAWSTTTSTPGRSRLMRPREAWRSWELMDFMDGGGGAGRPGGAAFWPLSDDVKLRRRWGTGGGGGSDVGIGYRFREALGCGALVVGKTEIRTKKDRGSKAKVLDGFWH